MKVVMVNTELTRGGAARMAATLASAILAEHQDWDIRLYHCENNDNTPPFYGLRRPLSRHTNALVARIFGALRTIDFGVADEILCKVEDANIVHLHNLHGYYLDYQTLLRNLGNWPVVWTWHDMWGATGRCGSSIDCDLWKTGCPSCPHKKYYPAAWIDHAAHEYRIKNDLYDTLQKLHIVTPSPWMRGIALQAGFPSDRVSVIPNPVNLENYYPRDRDQLRQELGLERDLFYLLFVASDCDDPLKGHEDFCAVVAKTKLDGIAVGRPPKDRSDQIKYIGTISDPKTLAKWYAAADILIVPSKTDNYPNTVIEALACGTPVFGFSVGGISFQVPDMLDSLVKAGEINKLASKVMDFVETNRQRSGLSIALAEHARKNWDPVNIAKKYISLYQRVIS